MPEKILIPSTADFESAQEVHRDLLEQTQKLTASDAVILEFDGPDPTLLSTQLAASCLMSLRAADCSCELSGQAQDVLGAEQVVLS